MSSYSERNTLLIEIGFPSYQAYLQHEIWGLIKDLCQEKLRGGCHLCKRPARVLHHREYTFKVLIGEDLSQLFPLCHGCHKRVELDSKGKKRTLPQSIRAFDRLEKKLERFKVKRLPAKERAGKAGWCKGCGGKPIKKMLYCRPCLKNFRRR